LDLLETLGRVSSSSLSQASLLLSSIEMTKKLQMASPPLEIRVGVDSTEASPLFESEKIPRAPTERRVYYFSRYCSNFFPRAGD
jgi:hypothetical protein